MFHGLFDGIGSKMTIDYKFNKSLKKYFASRLYVSFK